MLTFFGEIAVNIACGPEADPYDYYVSYFHNNIQGDTYKPFSYNANVYLYDDNEVEDETQINSNEWAKYTGASVEDVYRIMYRMDSLTEIHLQQFADKAQRKLPDSLYKNTFIKALLKNKPAMKYFLFAKSCEPLAVVHYNLWDPTPRDTAAMNKKADEAISYIKKVKRDEFLKLRYAYQAERLFHYAGNGEQSINVYENYIKTSQVNSAVKNWGLAIYAGAIRHSGKPVEAAYLFAKVFEQSPERRIQAYKNYFYTSSKIEDVLKLAQNDQDRATIYAINAFGNSDIEIKNLEKIYQLEPASLLNGALLVREVNKLEERLNNSSDISRGYYESYFSRYNDVDNDSLRKKNIKNLTDVKQFALKLAAEKKYPQPEFGTITAAYLFWMEDRNDLAVEYLNQLNPDQLPERLRDQYRITDLLVRSKNISKGDAFNDDSKLVATLKWLDEKRYAENKEDSTGKQVSNRESSDQRFTITTRNFYQQVLAPAYLKMGDTALAALAMVKADINTPSAINTISFNNISYQATAFWQNYLTPKSMAALATYKVKNSKNGLTGMLIQALNHMANDDFYELYGTTYLRTHQYDKALIYFKKVSASYQYFSPADWYADDSEAKLVADPFIETINDYPKKYASNDQRFNKVIFAREMARLQKLILTDKKNAARYYYRMANAVYQTGYYGNSWFLISYDWSTYANEEKPKYNYDVDYKLAKTAAVWYAKARALSTNQGFKAKCTFMLAKCAQKQIISNADYSAYSYYNTKSKAYKDFIAANYNNPYFKELKTKYAKTPFYKIAVNECSYLEDFIAGK